MRRTICGVVAVVCGTVCGCSSDEPGPSSTVSQPMSGGGGSGGSGGLDLGLGAGKGGGGAGGTMGGGGAAAGASTAGTSGGGGGGGSSVGGGSGGTKPAGMCTRAAGSDVDCADFWAEEGYTQAYACSDRSAATQLPRTLGKECASVNFVAGAAYGACCQPVP